MPGPNGSCRVQPAVRVALTIVGVAALSLCVARVADAQALGYGVAGPAGVTGFLRSASAAGHVAGGGEALLNPRAGIGGELGILANSSSALIVLSINGVVHVVPATAQRRLSPFLVAGFSLMGSGEGGFGAWTVGAGVDLWAKNRVGLRVDARDHVRPDSRGIVQYWTVRGGVVFR